MGTSTNVLPNFDKVDNHPKGWKKYAIILMNHLVPYLILLCIYVPFGFVLRFYFFEDYFEQKMIPQLYMTFAYTGIGVFVSTVFSMAHFKVGHHYKYLFNKL